MTARGAIHHAYLHTTYRVVTTPEPVDIRIGQRNSALDRLLQANGVQRWAFVTASNPRSQAQTDEDNARRNDELKQSLDETGWRYLDGVGLPDGCGWQPEHSVLILGMGKRAAIALARRWGQNAIVCGIHGEPSELVWAD